MSTIPEHMLQKRQTISQHHLVGQGIEVGALHYPLWVSDQATVRYVDRLPVAELRQQYPELQDFDLVHVDIVDNGEHLVTIVDDSLDFLIGNHLLEHCENPLGTMRNHLSKVKDEGILYYAIPDKRHSFDSDRPLTPFEHLVKDDMVGTEWSRRSHFREWVEYVNHQTDAERIEQDMNTLDAMNYSIHFHVWDQAAFETFLYQAQSYLGEIFTIEQIEPNDTEIIAILRKRPISYRSPATAVDTLHQQQQELMHQHHDLVNQLALSHQEIADLKAQLTKIQGEHHDLNQTLQTARQDLLAVEQKLHHPIHQIAQKLGLMR